MAGSKKKQGKENQARFERSYGKKMKGRGKGGVQHSFSVTI